MKAPIIPVLQARPTVCLAALLFCFGVAGAIAPTEDPATWTTETGHLTKSAPTPSKCAGATGTCTVTATPASANARQTL